MEPMNLVKLQEHDQLIARSERELDQLPEKKAILEVRKKRVEVDGIHQKADMLLAKLEAELKRDQDEISTLDEKISTENAKMMQDTSGGHKRVQLLQREIDGLGRRKDKLENDSLALMERVEKAKAQRTTIDSALSTLDQREAALIARFQELGGKLKRDIAQHIAERDRLAEALPTDLLDRYEKIRASKGGIGVGKLANQVCTACRVELPIERTRELLDGPDIGICPQCRRLIVVRGTGDE